MPLLFGTTDGALVFEVENSETGYNPVQQDVEVQSNIFWSLLDDAYAYMEDRDLVETFWAAMIEVGAGDLLQAYIQDATTSLAETPLLSPRRWVPFDLRRQRDFGDGNLPDRVQGPFQSLNGRLSGVWQTSPSVRGAWDLMRSPITHRASVAWSFTLNYTSAQRAGIIRVGYFSAVPGAGGLFAGVTRFIDEEASQARLYVAHEGSLGTTVWEAAVGGLLPGVTYRIEAEYEASTKTMQADAYEVGGLKYAATEGVTDLSPSSAAVVNRIRVPGRDWASLGVGPGDYVVYGGRETEVVDVAGDQLVTRAYIFPADAASLEFDVRGDVLVAAVTLDIPARTGDVEHVVDVFGARSVKTSQLPSDLYASQHTTGAGVVVTSSDQQLVGSLLGWSFFDPSSPYRIRAIPRLVDRVRNPTSAWVGGLDVHFSYPTDSGTVLEFAVLPPDRVWAEHVAYDEHLLSSIYGRNVGIAGDSTAEYRLRLQGLYYAYFRGPARGAVRTGIHLLLGLPVAEADGVVEELEITYTGLLSRIRVAGRDYFFPRTIGTPLLVGAEVRRFQPLCYGVEVVDWTTDPYWFDRHAGVHELQKYHAFEVRAEAAAPDLEALPFALSFLSGIRESWKTYYVTAVSRHPDDVSVNDALALKAILSMWDVPCETPIPRYDSYDYQPYVTDWRYDQVEGPSWAITAGTQRHPQFPGVRDWLTDLSGEFGLDNGSTGAGTPSGGALTSEVGPSGPVSRKYVAVSRIVTGSAGEVVSGSLEFVDSTPGAFDNVQVGGRITSGGQTRLIVGADGDTLTLKTPFDFTGTGYPWTVVNDAFLRGQIASVIDDDNLAFAEAFTGETGTYRLSLIDLAVMNVFYDWQDEQCPEEELTFTVTLGSGHFGTTLLAGNFHELVEGQTTIGQLNDALTDIGPLGPVSDVYLCDPRGRWYTVIEVTTDTRVEIAEALEESFDGCPLYKSDTVYAAEFEFINGVDTVACTADMRGIINPGDFIQAVPALGFSPVADNPPVEVLSVDAADGLTLTLTSSYKGLDNVGTKAIYRGEAGQFPQAQDLPDGRGSGDVVTLNFTDFFPNAGATLTSTVAELEAP